MTTRRTSRPLPSGLYPRLTPLPDPPKPPDAMQQRRHIARADQVLRAFYSDRPDVLVSGEGYLCREPGEARRSPHPDCLVAFDVPFPPEMIEDEANGYVISEIGQPPDFVLEIASETTARRDETVKREIYASLLVKEYWRFDASGGRHYRAPLAGDRLLENGEYEPIPVIPGPDGVHRGRSEALGLELHWRDGLLLFWDPAGQEYLPDLVEALIALAAERAARRDAEARSIIAQAARQDAEERIAREQAARRDAEERIAREQAARQDAEERIAREQAARQDAEERIAREQAARRDAEERIRRLEAELRRRPAPE